jgi:tRNA (guanine37-N1)-methyltransferase
MGLSGLECYLERGKVFLYCAVLSVFPGLFEPFLNHSLIAKARREKLIEVELYNLRDYAPGKKRQIDDMPYGGGPGMVFKPDPIFKAAGEITGKRPGIKTLLLSPRGRLFNHEVAKELAREESLLFICGRYEGVDERVLSLSQIEEISIGDYVLGGGELPAMVIMEAVFRLIPGVIGDEDSVKEDSFYSGLLDYPHYTRPANFQGLSVPEVLLSGNHQQIRRWRRKVALRHTRIRRPDLLEKAQLNSEDREILQEIESEMTDE